MATAGSEGLETRLLRAMHYIERNLAGDLSLERIAREAYVSTFHFHRLFSLAVGMPVAEYVRHVRLESAAHQLRSTRLAVSEIAKRCGYESPDAFGRAFRARFEESPSVFRRRWRDTPPPLEIAPELILPSVDAHGVSIRWIDARRLMCMRHVGAYQTVWQTWRRLQTLLEEKLPSQTSAERIGISYDDPEMVEADRIRYDACVVVPRALDTAHMTDAAVTWREASEGEYAIVTHTGHYHLLGEAYRRLYVDWLPRSGRMPREEPSLEVYLDVGARDETELVTEIQLPLR